MIHAASSRPGFSTSARTLAFVLAATIALCACDRKMAAAPAPRPVVAVAAKADDVAMQASLPAQIEARYSTPLLAATLAGLAVVYLLPLALALAGNPWGAAAWLMMSIAYFPAVRFYRHVMSPRR